MKLETICEHTLDVERLTPGGWVLDAGCRGFEFARAMVERGMCVLAMDPSVDVPAPRYDPHILFERAALVGGGPLLQDFSDGTGNAAHLRRANEPKSCTRPVACVTVRQLMVRFGIDRFSAVKLDIEGAEYQVLATWPGDVADQISVEFHDFLGLNPRPQDPEGWYRDTWRFLDYWYEVAQHKRFEAQCAGANYWDTLLVAHGRRTGGSPAEAIDVDAVLADTRDRLANLEYLVRDAERRRRQDLADIARVIGDRLEAVEKVIGQRS